MKVSIRPGRRRTRSRKTRRSPGRRARNSGPHSTAEGRGRGAARGAGSTFTAARGGPERSDCRARFTAALWRRRVGRRLARLSGRARRRSIRGERRPWRAGLRYCARHARAARRRIHDDVGLVAARAGPKLALLAGLKPGAPEFAGTPIVRPAEARRRSRGRVGWRSVLALFPVADPARRASANVVGRAERRLGFRRRPALDRRHHGYFLSAAPDGRGRA